MSLTPDVFHDCRGFKVMVIEPYCFTPKLETAFEISEILSRNNEVTFAGPDALRCTTDERFGFGGRFANDFSRKHRASRYLPGPIRKLKRNEILGLAERPSVAEISPLVDMSGRCLESAVVDNFDLGMGLRSSLVSLTRNPAVAPGEHTDYSLALAGDAVFLYRITLELIRRERFDLVVLFNGRFAPARAVRRACEALGARYFIHERGSSLAKFAIYDCATPHQPTAYRNWVDAWWAFAAEPERNAREFLRRRRQGIVANWFSFTRNQHKGSAPPRADKTRVTFFTSSEDEFAAIGDEVKPDSPFSDQLFTVRSLGTACRERNYELVIRFHPNTPSSATALLTAAHDSAAIVIEPSSPIDSYSLADSSDIVISQNSTIAVEAAASGKPSYFTGRSIYEHCRSVRLIRSEADLTAALTKLDEPDPLDALKYANFLGAHGIDYQFYQPRGVFSGTYRGLNMNSPLATLLELRHRIVRGSR